MLAPKLAKADTYHICVRLDVYFADQHVTDYANGNTFAARGLRYTVVDGTTNIASGWASSSDGEEGCFDFDSVSEPTEIIFQPEVRVGQYESVVFRTQASGLNTLPEIEVAWSELAYDHSGTDHDVGITLDMTDMPNRPYALGGLALLGFAAEKLDRTLHSVRPTWDNGVPCSTVDDCLIDAEHCDLTSGTCKGNITMSISSDSSSCFSSSAGIVHPSDIDIDDCMAISNGVDRFKCYGGNVCFGREHFGEKYSAGIRRKMVVLHEFGHNVHSVYGADPVSGLGGPRVNYNKAKDWDAPPGAPNPSSPTQIDVAPSCRYNQGDPFQMPYFDPSNGGIQDEDFPWGRGHGLRSYEYVGDGYSEGFAHYIAAWVLNSTNDDEALLAYYKWIPEMTADWLPGFQRYWPVVNDQDPVYENEIVNLAGTTFLGEKGYSSTGDVPGGASDYLHNPAGCGCGGNVSCFQAGTELDWLRAFWKLSASQISGCVGPKTSIKDVMLALQGARGNITLLNVTPLIDLQFSSGILNCRWNAVKADEGIATE